MGAYESSAPSANSLDGALNGIQARGTVAQRPRSVRSGMSKDDDART